MSRVIMEQTGNPAKEIWIVGGPNGAGKTTWVREALLDQKNGLYLSADKIAAELSPESPEHAAIPAGREFLRQLRTAISTGDDLVVESTLSGRGMTRFLRLARTHGYRIIIVFIFIHRADLCVRRVKDRVRKGGHSVPETDIVRRHRRSNANFWKLYRPLADEWHVYFNGGDLFEMVASGDAESMIVHNRNRFSLVSASGETSP